MNFYMMLFVIFVLLLILAIFHNHSVNKNAREFFSPYEAAYETPGSSALYGWSSQTNKNYSFGVNNPCCPCQPTSTTST